MAQMETDGIEEAIRQLNKADLFTDENVKRMLTAGSEVMLTSVKSAFVESGHNNPGRQRRTGETLRHITKARVVRKDKNGVPYMIVTIHGTDKRGQRYGTKGFVLNYGRRTGGNIPADYYWSTAVHNTWQQANDKMSDVAADILKGE